MRRTLVLTIGLGFGLVGSALGLGGNLDTPSIAIPTDPATGEADPVTRKIAQVLQSNSKDFAGGSYINSHSVLDFAGGTEGVNKLLGGLAKIDGATIQVRLSKELGVTQSTFPSKDAPAESPCDLRINHLGWGDPRVLNVTIYLGGDRIDLDKLHLPAIKGHAAAEE